jgi:glycosyltransferase involved in cell wall biosynthesis
MTARVAFVGPLPPPVNGFSHMCEMVLNRLRTRMPVDVFDRAPSSNKPGLSLLPQSLKAIQYLGACLLSRNDILYLALSGGLGQLIDLFYVVIGRLFRRRIFVHHHSFAYINAHTILNRCFFAFVRKETHIVLSRGMGNALKDLYRLDANCVKVVSNAAFFDPVADEAAETTNAATPIKIGYLSNISLEKGFVDFFHILGQLRQGGIRYRAYVAGPVAPSAREQFETLMSSTGDVQYLGPVYGEAKKRFYQQLNIFVFPTRYVNEAEPLVLHEAMQAGVHVIACNRGAIPEMLANGAGLVFSSETIVNSAAEHIKRFSRDLAALAIAQNLSFQQARRIRASSALELETLLSCMSGAVSE